MAKQMSSESYKAFCDVLQIIHMIAARDPEHRSLNPKHQNKITLRLVLNAHYEASCTMFVKACIFYLKACIFFLCISPLILFQFLYLGINFYDSREDLFGKNANGWWENFWTIAFLLFVEAFVLLWIVSKFMERKQHVTVTPTRSLNHD